METSKSEVTLAGDSRVWLFEDGFGPGKSEEYQGLMKLGDPTFNFGDITRVEAPDPNRYNAFRQVAAVQGGRENPTLSLMGRYPADVSKLLQLGRRGCQFGVHAHLGKCKDPQNFEEGWEKILVFPGSRETSYSGENFGALGSDEQNPANETAEITAEDMYEVLRLGFSELAETEVAREIAAITVCDAVECGDCDSPSDGCQKVFAVMYGTGATPGTLPSLVYSEDGGLTWASEDISTMFSNEEPDDIGCVGGYVVVISREGGMHIRNIEDLLDGVGSWVENSNGLDLIPDGLGVVGGPIALTSVDASHTWLVGQDGHIYFVKRVTSAIIVQDAGVATTQDLLDVDALNTQNIVAVGDLNAVVHSTNGGDTWASVTGPAAGIDMTAVAMYGEAVWIVGTGDGRLFYTENMGVSWTEITLPASYDQVDDIQFVDGVIGYLAATAGGTGYILRTINGGASWYVLPELPGSIPDNDRINSLAVCDEEPNVVFGGGLGADGSDGIIVKGA